MKLVNGSKLAAFVTAQQVNAGLDNDLDDVDEEEEEVEIQCGSERLCSTDIADTLGVKKAAANILFLILTIFSVVVVVVSALVAAVFDVARAVLVVVELVDVDVHVAVVLYRDRNLQLLGCVARRLSVGYAPVGFFFLDAKATWDVGVVCDVMTSS